MSLIDNLHQSVKNKIQANVSGYAQAMVNDVKVSYDGRAFSYNRHPYPDIPAAHVGDLLYGQFAYAIATGNGQATADVFSESRLARLAHDAAEHPSGDAAKQAFARKIEAFYLAPGGDGVFMVR